MSSNKKSKAVRFAEGDEANNERPAKRPRSDDGNNKKKKNDRPNEDELDDVDDWENDEEDEEDALLPSEKQRLEARRARREQRQGRKPRDGDDDEDGEGSTRINDTTSLATEGVEIEPFHMENERNDGTGYFDGDTYVFRKRGDDEEPDAWVESLKDDPNATATSAAATKSSFLTDSSNNSSDSETESNTKVPKRTKEEWYARLLPLLTGTETIMQAVVRYGKLLKRQPLKRKGKHKKQQSEETETADDSTNNTISESFLKAQKSLNDLTEAANALLGMGEVDIYQQTQTDLMKLVPQQQQPEAKVSTSTTLWEYKGSQDNQIHGPYSGEQMKAWIQAGYFVGAQAVQIRSVKPAAKSAADDLLSDLMDDDDDNDGKKEEEDPKKTEMVRGEWQMSDKVDYDAE